MSATGSLSLMVGVAVATSLAVSAILGGPVLLDCAKAAGGLGACLHSELVRIRPQPSVVPGSDKAIASLPGGLLQAAPAPRDNLSDTASVSLSASKGTVGGTGTFASVATADVALAPAAGAVQVSTDPQTTGAIGIELSRAAGGMDASILVDGGTVEASVALAPAPGLDASAARASTASIATVEMAAGRGEVSTAPEISSVGPLPAAILTAAPGLLAATQDPSAGDDPVSAELSAPAGQLDTAVSMPAPPPAIIADLTAPTGSVIATGAASSAEAVSIILARPASAAADGTTVPAPPSVATIALDPPPAADLGPSISPPPDPPKLRKGPAAPVAPQIDPRFPNVLMLRLPKGADGSVITLQLN